MGYGTEKSSPKRGEDEEETIMNAKSKFGVKEVVAVGIGAALFVALTLFLNLTPIGLIPLPVIKPFLPLP